MPNFRVHYFVVKPTPVPVRTGTTGSATGLIRGADPAADAPRQLVKRLYEQYLAQYFQVCLPPGWTASVNQLPPLAGATHNPDCSGVTHWREPIVYWVSDATADLPLTSTSVERRPSLLLVRELREGYFEEFDIENLHAARQFIQTIDGADPGGRALSFGWAPLSAEVFSGARIPYDDVSPGDLGSQGWQRHQARNLANASFHEIAHGKCQWVNRPTGAGWVAAIPDSIHDHVRGGVCSASINHATPFVTADRLLMRGHVLCPMPYFKLGVPAPTQCYQGSSPLVPTPVP